MVHDRNLTVARTIADVRALVARWRGSGLTVGLVPTMGSLHAGHLALVDRARAENARVLATVFVNPLQFAPAEDFAAYPRDDDADFAALRDRHCDAVFAPSVNEMFPDGGSSIEDTATRVSLPRLAGVLCGRSRPTHFDGVATIVLRLLMIAQPDVAYFGEKDFQQLTIIKRLVADLSVPVRITGVPIVREPDGLAMSSRNLYLDARQRGDRAGVAASPTVRARRAGGRKGRRCGVGRWKRATARGRIRPRRLPHASGRRHARRSIRAAPWRALVRCGISGPHSFDRQHRRRAAGVIERRGVKVFCGLCR